VEVFRGMRRLRREHLVSCITEFTPHSIATREDPVGWLSGITAGCAVFEIHGMDAFLSPSHKLRVIARDEIPAFVGEVMDRPNAYTDLLFIPERLPGFETLCSRLVE
jgi:hypothetical protein